MARSTGIATLVSVVLAMFGILLFSGILSLGSAGAATGCSLDIEVPLMRPESGADSDAEGTLTLLRDKDEGVHAIDVHVTNIDGLVPHEVWIEYPHIPGTYLFISLMDREGDGGASYRIDNASGVTLPHGVTGVARLAGMGVQVRRGAKPILGGVIPEVK
jgi:hypothetical protein